MPKQTGAARALLLLMADLVALPWRGSTQSQSSDRHTNLRDAVGEIRDTGMIDALRRQMAIAAARQAVAAGNLANVNTPGYRARAVDFTAALERELGGGVTLAQTTTGHMPGEVETTSGTHELDGLTARRDGNTVQIDRELLEMTSAAGDFARAQTALTAKFRLVRYAINEGR